MTKRQAVVVVTLIVFVVGSTFLARVFWPRQVSRPQAQRVYEPAGDPPTPDDEHSADAPREMRPLGDDWKVVANGVIYQRGNPIGVWGVNGFGEVPRKRLEAQIRSLITE